MLTCKTVTPERAVSYFLQGYYLEGTSRWFGKGAEILGLQGAVDNEQVFTNIVNGLSPDGTTELSKRKVETKDRRAALDCTFSAPKSVSLTALVGGDERLRAAHQLAVEKTLSLMQERYAHTRVTIGKERQVVNTGNLVIAEFNHIETRELDPHLHTHCLLMNMTQLPNDEWYSHLNEAIYANKKFLGMVYQHYLALEVQELGYEVEPKEHGQFDISGYTKEQLMDFSKRRQQILAAVGDCSSWREREAAWSATRKRKEKVSPEELKAKWREEALALGLRFVQPTQPQLEHKQQEVNPQILSDAIAHCSERTVAFRQEELEKFILSEGRPFDVTQLQPFIKESNELIRIVEPNEIRFTTEAALQREIATIRLMQQGQGQVQAIADLEMVSRHLEKTALNSGQRQAVQLAATSTDQFIAWQGVAGAGKTFALKQLQLLAIGYNIKGFAPSAQAAKVLGEQLGIETNTVARLLTSQLPEQIKPNQIWIVDEAGLLSSNDAHSLLQRATQEQAKVVLVGDTQQLSAVEAGNPFKSLQQAGIETAYLNESLRQRTPELKLAVDLIAEGKIAAGFARLEANGCLKEVTAASRVDAIAAEYMAALPEQRAKTLVLAGTNAERLDIIQAIRARLLASGSLGQEATAEQLKAKDLTTVQMKYTHHFEVGDVVVPLRSYKRRGLEKGELYSVVSKTQDRLTLQAADGTHLEVDTGFSKAVYQRQQMSVAVGDRLKWVKNDRTLERRNGQEFTVTTISGDSAQIQYLDSDRRETISLAQAQHLDYALVSTTYSSQGKTAERVLIAADSTIGKESFYVAVSRAKYELKLYTEDKAELLELAHKSKAKENPLELLRRQQVKEQVGASPVVSAQPINQSSVHEQPRLKRQAPSPSSETQPTVTLPIERSTEKPKRVEVSHQSPVKHSAENEIDMAAIMKAAARKLPDPPGWLTAGKRVYHQKQGWGEVAAISGPRLIIKLDSGERAHILEWPDAIKSKAVVPEPTEAFWIPGIAGEAPSHIESKHWQELVEGSAIHPGIAARNFRSLQHDLVEQAHEAWGHLFYSDKLERSNTGRLSTGTLNRYAHVEAGGWWCGAGVDPNFFQNLQAGEKPPEKLWGCFKPNTPREDSQKPGKRIKYEHPLKTELSMFLLDVPDQIAQPIYEKLGMNPTESDRTSGFWYCVWKYNLPITLTEGAKKAASLLSQGHAAIGLPGIYAGYRSKDEQGNEIKAHLHEELAVFATPAREIKICFDYDTRSDTKRNIDIAISRTGSLLERREARVSVVSLPGPDKGVDDLIKVQGPLVYEKLDSEALRLRDWRERNKQQQHLAPEPPQKLSLEERKERQRAKLAGGVHPHVLVANQPVPVVEAVNQQPSVPVKPPTAAPEVNELQENRNQRSPLQLPISDESKWVALRQYLVETRHLPEALVDELHHQGSVYADSQQNVVFVRKNQDGKITGANSCGTHEDSHFKELATGSQQDGGWFSFSQGQGKLERIVLVESAIDAMSAAALARQKTGMTMFISADRADAVPIELLRQYSSTGVKVMVAYDADPTSEEMARIVMAALPGSIRVRPSLGKDWNEQLLHQKQSPQLLWKHYSQNVDQLHPLKIAGIVALVAMKDGHSPQRVRQILEHDPELTKIRQRGGDEMVQNYLLTVMRSAEAKMPGFVEEYSRQISRNQERYQNQNYDLGIGY